MSTSGEESSSSSLGSLADNRNSRKTSSHIKGGGSSCVFSRHGSLREAHHLSGHEAHGSIDVNTVITLPSIPTSEDAVP